MGAPAIGRAHPVAEAAQPMQIIRSVAALRQARAALPGRVALVPTMGALHAGHMALVAAARAHADHVVVSIFVNPKQFGPHEDLEAYPRRESADAALLTEGGVNLLWAPPVSEMYPPGFATNVSVSGVSDGLDGAARPGHFDGVATVVLKLFNQVQPDVALFGEKDYQQLAVIRRFVMDLDLPVTIVGVGTERTAEGLALSSRNAYLSVDERRAALALPAALHRTAGALAGGAPVLETLAAATAALRRAGFESVDYVALCDAVSLEPLGQLDRPARLLAAARIGRTRLIDNIGVDRA